MASSRSIEPAWGDESGRGRDRDIAAIIDSRAERRNGPGALASAYGAAFT